MPLTLFKALLAQMANLNVMMVKHVARLTKKAMGAVLFLRLFVVKAGITVAGMHIFAVNMGVVANKLAVANIIAALFLMVFVVMIQRVRAALMEIIAVVMGHIFWAVAPMDPNVMYNTRAVSGHKFCLC